ncbi:hypothetical protein ACC691_16950 [Rhizobium johnstonii]|uniref:hypothetical protein n=1 Tax=Rhizobium johnstonii TaxID=3019933 RepID=UPI003F9476AC
MHTHSNDGEAMSNGPFFTPIGGLYWGPLVPLEAKDAHHGLLAAIEGRSNVKFLTATVYEHDTSVPCGQFDIAVDADAGDGCGMYRLSVHQKGRDVQDITSPALWYQCNEPNDVVAKVHKYLVDVKYFENLYSYADEAVTSAKQSEPVH